MSREDVLGDVIRDAFASLNAAVPDALLAVTKESYLFDSIITPIAERVTEALDEDDLLRLLEQCRGLRWRAAHPYKWTRRRTGGNPGSGETTVEDFVRAAVDQGLTNLLRDHIAKRAAEFAPGQKGAP